MLWNFQELHKGCSQLNFYVDSQNVNKIDKNDGNKPQMGFVIFHKNRETAKLSFRENFWGIIHEWQFYPYFSLMRVVHIFSITSTISKSTNYLIRLSSIHRKLQFLFLFWKIDIFQWIYLSSWAFNLAKITIVILSTVNTLHKQEHDSFS